MEIDWSRWTPRERATLCFICDGDRVLLIHKKRGLGAGKVNGPGGKIDPGETALESAIRETIEEVGVTPLNPQQSGELFFQFADGYSLHCTVFRANEHSGTAIETAEAVPFWTASADLPFDRMWADDRHWLPLLLAGQQFVGRFVFDGNEMLSRDVRVVDDRTPPP